MWWGLSASGQISIGQWAFTAPATALQAASVTRTRTHKPVSQARIGYRRNHTVMARGDIAAALFYADGTAILPPEPPTNNNPIRPVNPNTGTVWFAPDGKSQRYEGNRRTFRANAVTFRGDYLVTLAGWTVERDQGIPTAQATAEEALKDAADAALTATVSPVTGAINTPTGPGTVVANTVITIAAGAIAGIGTGAGTAIANSLLTAPGGPIDLAGQTANIGQVAGAGDLAALDNLDLASAYATGTLPITRVPAGAINSELVPSINAAAGTAVYANVSGRPTTLAAINISEGGKLSGIEAGATVGATAQQLANISADIDVAETTALWSNIVGQTNAPTNNADVTALSQARLDSPAGRNFTANFNGTVLDENQLPATFQFKRFLGATDVSASGTTWTVLSQNGITGGTVTISNGVANIPTGVQIAANAEISIKAARDGLDLFGSVAITRSDAPASNSGGSSAGTTVNDSTLNSVTTASMIDISDEMTVKTGAAGTINFSGLLAINCATAAPTGSFGGALRWQIKTVGGSYNNVGSSDTAHTAVATVTEDVDLAGFYYESPGSIDAAASITGLSANTDYVVKLRGKADEATTGKSRGFGGTIYAVGS
jgi:hypothetical protein